MTETIRHSRYCQPKLCVCMAGRFAMEVKMRARQSLPKCMACEAGEIGTNGCCGECGTTEVDDA